jgi:hypothetical protein
VSDTTFSELTAGATTDSSDSTDFPDSTDSSDSTDFSVSADLSVSTDPSVRAAIKAAYEVAGYPGPTDLRAHDLLRRLRRDVRILDQATDWVRKDTLAHPDSAVAQQGLMLLERARLIGLFY